MDLNNEVHGERLIQGTTTNPKSRGVLLPSHGGERWRGVGEGGEVAGDDSSSGSPLIAIDSAINNRSVGKPQEKV
jgi:hypothetical protein